MKARNPIAVNMKSNVQSNRECIRVITKCLYRITIGGGNDTIMHIRQKLRVGAYGSTMRRDATHLNNTVCCVDVESYYDVFTPSELKYSVPE